jgi:hypothetical protein
VAAVERVGQGLAGENPAHWRLGRVGAEQLGEAVRAAFVAVGEEQRGLVVVGGDATCLSKLGC